eukprot:TRINITY_DN15302_c0_g1_i1.p1 TRINITY_DN15302_c0_g1~~TRINITY_DN15302_c0_g1_i1.p1  ORF type:complete len:117 (+),score=53.93 TRINITY_DN15302_c0_g1_i1:233-583(+)
MANCSNACIFGISFAVMWGIIGIIILIGYIAFLIVGNPYTARRGEKKKKKVLEEEEEEEIVEVIDNNEPVDGEEEAGNNAKSVGDSSKVAAEMEKSNEPASDDTAFEKVKEEIKAE